MKRRNFILGGGLLATLSLGVTATNASLADSVTSAADFRVINEFEPTADLVANPSTPDTLSAHTWTTDDVTTSIEIDTITANYDFGGSTATFENVDNTDIIVELTRSLTTGTDRDTISVNSDTYSGSSATFDLSGNSTTNIVDDPDNPNLRVEINAVDLGAGIENPPTEDTYNPTLTLTNDNGETQEVTAELTLISGQSFFATTITDVPATYTENDPIQVDYEVDNTGDETDTQDIALLVDGTEKDSTSVKLDPGDSPATGSLSYSPTSSDGASIDLKVKSNDDSDSDTITKGNTFTLSLNPTTPGASDATHTWSAADVDFQGEIDTITVDYDSTGASLDGLRTDRNTGDDLDEDVVVKLTRSLSGGPSKDVIGLNNGDSPYSGSTATFDLSGFYTTDIVGEIDVIVGYNSIGVTNPGTASTYTADITLDGDQDSFTDTVEFTIE